MAHLAEHAQPDDAVGLARLASEDEQLRVVLRAAIQAHDAIVVWERDLGIVFWNRGAEKLYGWSAEEALGRVTHELFRTEGHPPDFEDQLAGGHWTGELTHSTRDGRRVVVESRHSVLTYGPRTYIFESARDVTARAQADQVRGAFLGMLSHELRSPVTTITGGVELALREGTSEEIRRSLLADVADESRRLERLVDNLLVLARADAGSELGGDDVVALRPLIDRVIGAERRRAPATAIEANVPTSLPPVRGDEGSVELVIRNLVANARKYGLSNEPIVVAAAAADEGVEVHVLDRGPGFAAGDEALVFDLFYRAASTASVASGSGIGLHVAKVLIAAMGGRIWARNREGGGADCDSGCRSTWADVAVPSSCPRRHRGVATDHRRPVLRSFGSGHRREAGGGGGGGCRVDGLEVRRLPADQPLCVASRDRPVRIASGRRLEGRPVGPGREGHERVTAFSTEQEDEGPDVGRRIGERPVVRFADIRVELAWPHAPAHQAQDARGLAGCERIAEVQLHHAQLRIGRTGEVLSLEARRLQGVTHRGRHPRPRLPECGDDPVAGILPILSPGEDFDDPGQGEQLGDDVRAQDRVELGFDRSKPEDPQDPLFGHGATRERIRTASIWVPWSPAVG